MGKKNRGFTLVELIVVLVILAILAAILVPSLLGFIDQASAASYLPEARALYTAIQTVNTEDYAKEDADKNSSRVRVTGYTLDPSVNLNGHYERVNKYADPVKYVSVTGTTVSGGNGYMMGIAYQANREKSDLDDTSRAHLRKWYTVKEIHNMVFQSQNGKYVCVSMVDGEWTVHCVGDSVEAIKNEVQIPDY